MVLTAVEVHTTTGTTIIIIRITFRTIWWTTANQNPLTSQNRHSLWVQGRFPIKKCCRSRFIFWLQPKNSISDIIKKVCIIIWESWWTESLLTDPGLFWLLIVERTYKTLQNNFKMTKTLNTTTTNRHKSSNSCNTNQTEEASSSNQDAKLTKWQKKKIQI